MDIDAWESVGTNVAEGGYARIGLEQCYNKFIPTKGVVKPLERSSDDTYEGKFDKNYEFPYKGDQLQPSLTVRTTSATWPNISVWTYAAYTATSTKSRM